MVAPSGRGGCGSRRRLAKREWRRPPRWHRQAVRRPPVLAIFIHDTAHTRGFVTDNGRRGPEPDECADSLSFHAKCVRPARQYGKLRRVSPVRARGAANCSQSPASRCCVCVAICRQHSCDVHFSDAMQDVIHHVRSETPQNPEPDTATAADAAPLRLSASQRHIVQRTTPGAPHHRPLVPAGASLVCRPHACPPVDAVRRVFRAMEVHSEKHGHVLRATVGGLVHVAVHAFAWLRSSRLCELGRPAGAHSSSCVMPVARQQRAIAVATERMCHVSPSRACSQSQV